ncbi:MAG: response regulator, partial [Erysipelotrichaceae bacterium]|nr:response regulator [Erysipelotrichaceae bacterium]
MEILAVDDNPAHLSDLKDALRPLFEERAVEYSFQECSDPSGVQLSVRPDLIFLDVELSRHSGLELAASLHTRYPESIVVLMSSWSHYSIEGYKTGALRFLPKPFSEQTVRSVLDDSFF